MFTKNTAILFILIALAPCHAESTKTFGSSNRPSLPFYAETVFRSQYSGHESFNTRTRIWYQDKEHYRVELIDYPDQNHRTYLVRSGARVYSTLARLDSPERAKWLCCPVFWTDSDILEVTIQRKWKLRDPVLLETERLRGLKVEHWIGQFGNKRPAAKLIAEIWVSTDSRFPMVIKVDRTSTKSVVHWEITRLRLDQQIPSYMLTPQVHPKSGLLAQLKMTYKPLWMFLLRDALYLLAVLWLISALMTKRSITRKILSATGAVVVISGLLSFTSSTDQYMNHLSGLPVLVLIGGMVAAALSFAIKRFPIPGDVRMFAGTRWPVLVWTLLAAGVGLLLRTNYEHAAVLRQYVITLRGLPFLPQTLVTVAVFFAIWAALEEVLFRGYITGLLKRRFSSLLVVNMLQALIFVIWHIPNRLTLGYPLPRTIGELFGIFILGLILGRLRLKYNNLAAPWLVHTGYNIGVYYAIYAGIYNLLGTFGH
ncbi:MAG: CPBP family intramembrane glutamic endopeptidase [Armatimonadota bacterium]